MNKDLSVKISIAGFICTLMVVYRHSLNYLAFFHSWSPQGLNGIVEDSCMRLTQIAVPYFFMVSGFFFLGKNYYEPQSYRQMIIKKIHTLFIPFVIWNVTGALCLLPFDKKAVGTDIFSVIQNLFNSHWYGPLWYVRDLMVVMMLYPIYGWLFRIKSSLPIWITVTVLFYLWKPIDCSVLSSECLVFFVLGGLIGKHPVMLSVRMRLAPTLAISAIWFAACFTGFMTFNEWIHKLTDMTGIVAFWQLLNHIPETWRQKMLHLSTFSFLIYVMHFYPMKLFKQGIAHIFYGNDIIATITYILLPIMISYLIILIGQGWIKLSPKTYSLAIGNRI